MSVPSITTTPDPYQYKANSIRNKQVPRSSDNDSSKDPLEETLDSVQSALSSGDTEAAQSAVAGILSGDSTKGGSPIQEYLKQLQDSVKSGNTANAQGVLSSLKEFLATNPPPKPGSNATYGTDGSLNSGGTSNTSSLNLLA